MLRPPTALALVLFSVPQGFEAVQARWRAHYAAVERELARAAPRDVGALHARRAAMIEVLAACRERGDFARQEDLAGAALPQFVDRAGRRCAVAELLHADGRGELVERVRRTNNTAWVVELAGDPEFDAWLDGSGLTLDEAVRIQTPAEYIGPGDTVAPSDVPAPPVGDAPRPAVPLPRSSSGASLTPGTAPSTGSPRPLDGWWTWWEYNKLDYLDPRGLEQRLASRDGCTPADVAAMTEPLRAVRKTLLLEALQDPEAEVRAAAALSLGRLARADAVAPLLLLLSDPSQRVREHALLGLGASGTSGGARVLLGLLEQGVRRGAARAGDELVSPRALTLAVLALAVGRREGMDPGVAQTVALLAPRVDKALRPGTLWAACLFQRLAPDPALESLMLELAGERDAPEAVRAAALEALGDSSAPPALARLQDALFGRSLELRRSAALALGRSPQPAATAILLTASELEAEPLARGFVLLSLGMRGGREAREVLLDTLFQGPIASEPWAALALGLHARGARDALVSAALLEVQARVRNEDSRPAVLLALALAHESAAAGLAREALESAVSPRERGYAATALALLGGDANQAILRARLALEGSGFVRASIAQGLAVLGEDADVPSLFLALHRLRDRGLQAVTAASLGQLGSAAALAGLDQLARRTEGSALVRATALGALGVLLERGEPLALPDVSRGANYALYEDWTFELFLLAL